MRRLVLSASMLLALGCSTGSDDAIVDPPELCQRTLEEIAAAYSRCGQDFKQAYDFQLQAIAGGDCANVSSIRDEKTLVSTCFPSLKAIACVDLQAGQLDASCIQQLQRSK